MIKKTILSFKIPLLLIGSGFLVGCQSLADTYDTIVDQVIDYIDGDIEEESSEVETEKVEPVDFEHIPTMRDVLQGLEADQRLRSGISLFSDTADYTLERHGFEITVDEMEVFKISKADQAIIDEFNFDDQAAAIAVLQVKIVNHRAEEIFFPITNMKLSYEEATTSLSPSQQLYPEIGGNLIDLISADGGAIQPGQAINGFLVYGLGKTALKEIQSLNNFYLNIEPPRVDATDLSGLTDRTFGTDMIMYLPMSNQSKKLLQQQQQQVPDVLSTENWGEKTVLAEQVLDKKATDNQVTFHLHRVEVSDFEPNEYHEESFQSFVNGVVIVSMEYTVTNDAEESVFPADETGMLTINEDNIFSEYVLTPDNYGQEVAPGESLTFVKAFALDKQYYVQYWQESPILIELTAPTLVDQEEMLELESDELSMYDGDEVADIEEMVASHRVNFRYRPQLLWEIAEDLTLIKPNSHDMMESIEESLE